jgi:hypothetical protein
VIEAPAATEKNDLTRVTTYESGPGSNHKQNKRRNTMKTKRGAILATAALAGLVTGAMLSVSGCASSKAGMESTSSASKHDCAGKNACKGQGGCKTAAHACKGQNDCKGQGGCKAT